MKGKIKIDREWLKVEWRDPSTLAANPYNFRKHPESQKKVLRAALAEEGWIDPVIYNKRSGRILDGHARVDEALAGGVDKVPVIEIDVDEATEKKIIVRHDRIGALAEIDDDMLRELLGEIPDLDLSELGWTDFEMAGGGLPGADPDEEAELPEGDPVSKPGDIWLLGAHRLLCGDATSAADVAALLNEDKPHLMVTDPPYGVEYNPEWREGKDLGIGKRSKGKVLNDDRADWREAWSLFPGCTVYAWCASLFLVEAASSLVACGFILRNQIIWRKQHFALSQGNYHWQHEPCWYAVKKGENAHWSGSRTQSTIWDIANNNSFGNANKEETWGHGTQKPVECMKRPMMNNSKNGDYVYDPFCGSGTTIIAEEMSNRRALCLEISPAYVDMAVRRWEKFTGKQAELKPLKNLLT